MLAPLFLALTIASDPRPALVELQLAGRRGEALARADQELRERPDVARQLGLDYLRGNILSGAGRSAEAADAFGAALAGTPDLALYSRYRLALEKERQKHPEIAAGLVAKVAAASPDSPLLPDAVRLLARTLTTGGDCRVLRTLRADLLPGRQRRELLLSQADCALRMGFAEVGRGMLVGLLREERRDDFARSAAERLATMVSPAERGALPMFLGLTFHQHRDFERASDMLRRALGLRSALTGREAFEAQMALGSSQLSQQLYDEAATTFAGLAARSRAPEERAQGLFLQAWSFELGGKWSAADTSYRQAHNAQAVGPWSAPALLAALRIEWRSGGSAPALALHEILWSRPEWRREACRAALFLAASDLAQRRSDRARAWLDRTASCNTLERLEASYWRGRMAELGGLPKRAVGAYLDLLRGAPYHPLARSAWNRLAQGSLAAVTLAEGRRLAALNRVEDLYGAWLILRGPEAQEARGKLAQRLAADPAAAHYLTLAPAPVARWPLWSRPLDSPEEKLLALGAWHEGASRIAAHFPPSDPALAFRGADLLARGGDFSRSIAAVEALRSRAPKRLPPSLLPVAVRRLEYPFLYREAILAEGKIRGVPIDLLTALIREESRFDAGALSQASTRGLTQLSLPTAQRLAAQLKLERLSAEDLYKPGVSISLGAAQLGILLRQFEWRTYAALGAYTAGEREAILWSRYCFTGEPEEYFSKIGNEGARDYVRRVVDSAGQYAELYR